MAPRALFMLAAWTLAGIAMGFAATWYGVCRAKFRIWPVFRELLDWLFFVGLGVLVLVVLFWADWGVLRGWSLVWIAVGYGLWTGLAAPVVYDVLMAVAHVQARVAYWLGHPWRVLFRWFRKSSLPKWLHRIFRPPIPPESE